MSDEPAVNKPCLVSRSHRIEFDATLALYPLYSVHFGPPFVC